MADDQQAGPDPDQPQGPPTPEPTQPPATKPSMPYADPEDRPRYAPYQVEEVWEFWKDENGRVFDPNTGEELFWDKTKPRSGQWDMGHLPGKEYWRLHDDYINGRIDLNEFLRQYRDPANYWPEAPGSNRGRASEAP